MDIKNFVLSYYDNSTENFHIQKLSKVTEAQKPHTHDYFQIYFISKGTLEHHIKESSAQLNQGDMFIIPPGAVHYITPKPNTVFYVFSFMEELFTEINSGNKLARNFLRSLRTIDYINLKPRITVNSEEIIYLENIMAHILKEFNEKPVAYYDTIVTYAQLLVTILAREYYSKNVHIKEHFEDNKQYVLHCIEYIDNNFADAITLDEMAKKSTMSKSNFCSLFYKLTGKTFNKYLNMRRIKASLKYIKKGYKITAIYGLCGYNDFSTFNRNFNKIMGMSPIDYKKLNK
mgnify:CR=1 FL=1